MSALQKFYVVIDAGTSSVMADIMWESSASEIVRMARSDTQDRHPAFYLSQDEAREDARARLNLAALTAEYLRAVVVDDANELARIRADLAVGRRAPA